MNQSKSRAAEQVGRIVRDLRISSSLSRRKLADRADVAERNLARIEDGQGNPTLHVLIQLATALDVDPSVFVKGLGAVDLPKDVRPYSEADFRRELRRREES